MAPFQDLSGAIVDRKSPLSPRQIRSFFYGPCRGFRRPPVHGEQRMIRESPYRVIAALAFRDKSSINPKDQIQLLPVKPDAFLRGCRA